MKKYLMSLAVFMAFGSGVASAQNSPSMPNNGMGTDASSTGTMDHGDMSNPTPHKKSMKKKMHKDTMDSSPMTKDGMDKPDTKH